MDLQVKDLAAAVLVREAAHRSNMVRQAKAALAVVVAVVALDRGVVAHHLNTAHQDKVVHRVVSEEVHHRNTAHQDKVHQAVSEEAHRNSMVHRHLNRNSVAQDPHRLPNMVHHNKVADLHHHNTVHHNKTAVAAEAAAAAVSVIKFSDLKGFRRTLK